MKIKLFVYQSQATGNFGLHLTFYVYDHNGPNNTDDDKSIEGKIQ